MTCTTIDSDNTYDHIINEEYVLLTQLEKDLINRIQECELDECQTDINMHMGELRFMEEKLTDTYLEIYKFGELQTETQQKNHLIQKIDEINKILSAKDSNQDILFDFDENDISVNGKNKLDSDIKNAKFDLQAMEADVNNSQESQVHFLVFN